MKENKRIDDRDDFRTFHRSGICGLIRCAYREGFLKGSGKLAHEVLTDEEQQAIVEELLEWSRLLERKPRHE